MAKNKLAPGEALKPLHVWISVKGKVADELYKRALETGSLSALVNNIVRTTIEKWYEDVRAESVPRACVGWSFHMFSIGADKCSMCGVTREQAEAERALAEAPVAPDAA